MSDARRAIEALRAGVPNRAAIRLLGTAEDEIRERFIENLQRCRRQLADGGQPTGQVIAGGFGTGKSHLLGYLQELALNEDFVVSWVVISKETPLFDPGKLYISAMRNATIPRRNDDAMTAVLGRLRPKGDAFEDLTQWTESAQAGLSPLFAALLHLFRHPSTSPERMQQIARFLAGGKIAFASVKQWLREVGAARLYVLKPVRQADLVRQRLRFVPRLIAAAGYSGWVLLLDEVELIGRYSLLQRGRSYAELARWLGLDDEEKIPGVVTVAAITEDFTSEVIDKRRDDEKAPLKLTDKNERRTAERARLGIDMLERKQALLRPPSKERLQASLDKTRGLYRDAYGWNATVAEIGEITVTKSMRQYIKSWITAWDLERLYGINPVIETLDVAPDYEENTDIEQI
jgi:P-loop Domain of unknown function (DUF2791)